MASFLIHTISPLLGGVGACLAARWEVELLGAIAGRRSLHHPLRAVSYLLLGQKEEEWGMETWVEVISEGLQIYQPGVGLSEAGEYL